MVDDVAGFAHPLNRAIFRLHAEYRYGPAASHVQEFALETAILVDIAKLHVEAELLNRVADRAAVEATWVVVQRELGHSRMVIIFGAL